MTVFRAAEEMFGKGRFVRDWFEQTSAVPTLHICAVDPPTTIRPITEATTPECGRWSSTGGGDPDKSGTWRLHPFGFEVTGHSTLDDVTIPSSGRAGCFYGTDRWSEGQFFRSEITDYHLVTGTSPGDRAAAKALVGRGDFAPPRVASARWEPTARPGERAAGPL
jgi:hypothetical protein